MNCSRGYLHPMAEMEKFLVVLGNKLGYDLQSKNIMGGILDAAKIESINNF